MTLLKEGSTRESKASPSDRCGNNIAALADYHGESPSRFIFKKRVASKRNASLCGLNYFMPSLSSASSSFQMDVSETADGAAGGG